MFKSSNLFYPVPLGLNSAVFEGFLRKSLGTTKFRHPNKNYNRKSNVSVLCTDMHVEVQIQIKTIKKDIFHDICCILCGFFTTRLSTTEGKDTVSTSVQFYMDENQRNIVNIVKCISTLVMLFRPQIYIKSPHTYTHTQILTYTQEHLHVFNTFIFMIL